jgi:hypothetical protein
VGIYIVLGIVALIVLVACQGVSSFHLLSYADTSPSASNTANDLTANVDAEFSQRNGHYLFSEPYVLLGIAIFGNNTAEANMLSPTLNSVTKFNVNPLNDSSISLSPPRMDFWIHAPIPLPMNEEIQINVTTGSSSVAAPITAVLIIGPQGQWNNKIPQGITPVPIFEMRASCTPTLNSNAYSGLVPLAFEQSLRGGTYAVVGAEFIGLGVLAARIIFPQAPLINGRRMRPGCIASNAVGDQTLAVGLIGPMWLGQYGQFTTAELPQLEVLGLGTGTPTVSVLLRLVRLSETINVNYGM